MPFSNSLPTPSIIAFLRRQGYSGLSLHPFNSRGWLLAFLGGMGHRDFPPSFFYDILWPHMWLHWHPISTHSIQVFELQCPTEFPRQVFSCAKRTHASICGRMGVPWGTQGAGPAPGDAGKAAWRPKGRRPHAGCGERGCRGVRTSERESRYPAGSAGNTGTVEGLCLYLIQFIDLS